MKHDRYEGLSYICNKDNNFLLVKCSVMLQRHFNTHVTCVGLQSTKCPGEGPGHILLKVSGPCSGLSTRDAILSQTHQGWVSPSLTGPKGPVPLKTPRLEGKMCKKKDLLVPMVTPAPKHKDYHPLVPSRNMVLDSISVLSSGQTYSSIGPQSCTVNTHQTTVHSLDDMLHVPPVHESCIFSCYHFSWEGE